MAGCKYVGIDEIDEMASTKLMGGCTYVGIDERTSVAYRHMRRQSCAGGGDKGGWSASPSSVAVTRTGGDSTGA